MSGDINKRILLIRKDLGLIQSDVAKMLGIRTSTYSQMERKGNVTCETLIKLAKIFNVDVLTLLYGEDIPKIEKKIPTIRELKKDIDGIPPLVAKDVYEKFAVIAMRNLPDDSKQEIYELIMDKLKYTKKLIFQKE